MASFDVPQTQNTAPVLDYRCMFTSDLRRKQKRWQDGLLRFHTFNKRVMVYDDRNNFVGDTHWREEQLEEGEELELDRRGILVEIGEFQGQKDQDLTELVEKRRKDREDRVAAKVAASPVGSMMRGYSTPRGTEALRPKPLNEMLNPTGHYGRAVIPTISPFEEKQRLASKSVDENSRLLKRQKRVEDVPSKSGYAQSLIGTTLNLTSSRPPSTASIRYEPLRLKTSLPPKSNVSIDLTADSDEELTVRSDLKGKEQQSRKVPISRKRSPPAKSGYASSLTGAALSLSRPASFTSRKNNGSLLVNKGVSRPSEVKVSDIVEELPSAPEDHSFMDIDSSIGSPITRKKLGRLEKENIPNRKSLQDLFDSRSSTPIRVEEEPTNINKISRPRSTANTRSSSPPSPKEKPREISGLSESKNAHSGPSLLVAQSRPKLNELASSRQWTMKDSSAVEKIPDRPKSSLRIKSRPPRNKMMMLMGRSSSGSSSRAAVISSRQKSNTQSGERQQAGANELAPSQATLELDAFCQRQEEKIQARLKGQRSKVDVDEFLSSPLDSGIDHRTIDLLLSRKNDPPDREANSDFHQTNHEAPESASTGKTGTRQLSEKFKSSVSKTNIRNSIPVSGRLRGLTLGREDLPSAKAASGSFSNIPEQEGRRQSPEKQSSMETDVPQEKLVSPGKPSNIQRGRVDEESVSITEPTKATSVLKGDAIKPGITSSTSNLKPGGKSAVPGHDASRFAESPIQSVANAIIFRSPVPLGGINNERPRDRLRSPRSEVSNNRSRVQKSVTPGDTPENEFRDNIQKITSPKEKIRDGSAQQANAHNQRIPTIRPELSVLPSGNQTMKALPAHMTITISGTIEHFQPKLQSTSIAQHETVESPFATSEKIQVIQNISAPYATLSNRQSDLSTSVLKSSPKSSPVELPAGEAPHQNDNSAIRKRELAAMPPQAVSRGPKARLINPATRGKSLQYVTANAADQLNPTSNNMAAPPARMNNISRVNKTDPRDMAGRRVEAVPVAGRVDVREELRGGPWSRESFDLFGSWKPPGGDAVASVAANS